MAASAVLGSLLGGGFLAKIMLGGIEAQIDRDHGAKYVSAETANRLQAQINLNERRLEAHEDRLRMKETRLTKLEEAERLSWERAVDQIEKISGRMDDIAKIMGEQGTSQRMMSASLTSLADTVTRLERRLERLEGRA